MSNDIYYKKGDVIRLSKRATHTLKGCVFIVKKVYSGRMDLEILTKTDYSVSPSALTHWANPHSLFIRDTDTAIVQSIQEVLDEI